jgi:acyl-[acyl-carrier-protein]-phospholipid O-acyltransferase/long-chain-fatty-acid--[acyl-carrier-protein] ligase
VLEWHARDDALPAFSTQRKGERLIVAQVPISKTPEQICEELARSGMANLWIPSRDSFLEVDQIPLLGTGKPNLKKLKALVLAKFGQISPLSS